jgi:tetratricopeptide (TPR) repeat protein
MDLDANDARPRYNIALCYLLQGKNEQGMTEYHKAIEIDRTAKYEQIEEHLEDLEDAINKHPEWTTQLQPALDLLRDVHKREVEVL